MPDVALERVDASSAALLANLLELYVHDLSGVFGLEVGPDGRFGYDRLPQYWTDPETRFAFVIRRRDRIAGFALVTRGSPASDDPHVLDVAEFFVLRAHRRGGVGRSAAFLLWNRIPGRWVVRAALENEPAVTFWDRTIREYTGGAFTAGEYAGDRGRRFRCFFFDSGS